MSADPRLAELRLFAPHGEGALSPSPVSALRVACSRLPGGGLRLAYVLTGHIAALRVPAPDEPDAPVAADVWPLWRHTCFEAFVSVPGDGDARYREFNFSPAGLWAGGVFRRYREVEHEMNETAQAARPTLQVQRQADALRLTADLPAALLPEPPPLRLGLSAVVERADGQIEYWALAHPVADRPDFHHPDGWTLRLDAQGGRP